MVQSLSTSIGLIAGAYWNLWGMQWLMIAMLIYASVLFFVLDCFIAKVDQ